jgi:alpha-pyrone synthase
MSQRAAHQALSAWGGDLSSITHIVFGTMSAVIDAPTTDSRLINSLGLRNDVRRLSVQQMGCLTGFRCLSTAAELAAANPAARILVVVADVRSGLQNQLPHWEDDGSAGPSRACIISCALFRDAASAVVIGTGARAGEAPLAKVLRSASAFLPGTLDYVKITDGDDATISWFNSKDLPNAVSAAAPEIVSRLLKGVRGASLDRTAIAMHPGGPKILQLTAKTLGLSDAAFAVSWEFLQQHGNTSGSSNLALLHRELIRAGTVESPRTRDIMCVGIGPGLALEGLLLRRVPPKQQQQQQGLGLVASQLAHVQQAWGLSSSSRSSSRGWQGLRRNRSWVAARVAPRGDESGNCN